MRLKVGPRPSNDVTDAGAVTHLVLNILLPKVKSRKDFVGRFFSGLAKASRELLKTVVSPPESGLFETRIETKVSFVALHT